MPIDPSVGENGLVVNVGIDATKPIEDSDKFEMIDIPEDIKERIRNIMKAEGF